MTVRTASLKTQANCDKAIALRQKKLATVRRKLKGNNTPAIRAGLVQEEHELKEDIMKIKRIKEKLKT